MDRLYRQLRVRNPKPEKKEGEVNNTRDEWIPPQKIVPFEGEKKVSWLQRQYSEHMSQVHGASNGEFAAAVAAATYAINSLGRDGEKEESLEKKPVEGLQARLTETKGKKGSYAAKPADSSGITRWFSGKEEKERESTSKLPSFGVQDGSIDGLQATLPRTKSMTESSTSKPTDSSRISKWFSGKEEKEDKASAGEISSGKSEATEKKTLEDLTVNQRKPGKEIVTVPSINKAPAFTYKHQNDMESKSFASEKEKKTGNDASASVKTTASLTDDHKLSSSTSGQTETKADAWEKAEMAKIKRRHEKLYLRILEWENEKKKKAKRRSEREEGKLELRRAIALQQHRHEMARIDGMVAKAKAAADEKMRNDEHKIMEKANEIRSTGKIPRECFCI